MHKVNSRYQEKGTRRRKTTFSGFGGSRRGIETPRPQVQLGAAIHSCWPSTWHMVIEMRIQTGTLLWRQEPLPGSTNGNSALAPIGIM